MKRFLLKLFILTLPFSIPILCAEAFFYYNGELTAIDRVIERQVESPNEVYFLRKYFSSCASYFKARMINEMKPQILVVGASRVGEFRNFMFKPFDRSFYNATMGIETLSDLVSFIHDIKQGRIYKPELLIIGIDPWMLRGEDDHKTIVYRDEVNSLGFNYLAMGNLIREIIHKKALPQMTSGNEGFGFYGKTGNGFRKDGSVRYKTYIEDYMKNPSYQDRSEPPMIDRIKGNTFQFAPPYAINQAKVATLLNSLKDARSSGIEVLIYLPPFSEESYLALESSAQQRQWLDYYEHELSKELEKNGVDVIASVKPSNIGLDDRYMLDGVHPSEVMSAMELKSYLKKNLFRSAVLKKIDTNNLDSLLSGKDYLPVSFMKDE